MNPSYGRKSSIFIFYLEETWGHCGHCGAPTAVTQRSLYNPAEQRDSRTDSSFNPPKTLKKYHQLGTKQNSEHLFRTPTMAKRYR